MGQGWTAHNVIQSKYVRDNLKFSGSVLVAMLSGS